MAVSTHQRLARSGNAAARSRIGAILAPLAGAALLALAAGPALANVIVLQSSDPALKAGSQLGGDKAISLAAGKTLVVLTGDGKTKTLKGPLDTTVAKITAGIANNPSLWKTLTGVVAGKSAGKGTGATRSAGAGAGGAVAKGYSLTTMPAHADGTVCLLASGEYKVGQPEFLSVPTATFINMDSREKAVVRWQPGVTEAVWPKKVAPSDEAKFMVLLPRLPVRRIAIDFLDKEPAADELLAELNKRGCRFQVEAWVRDKMSATPAIN
ncbi:MAG: hypothetical protein AAFO79_05715 [Pseudomonadota bacterium]